MSLIHHHQAFERSEKPSKIGLTFLAGEPSTASIPFLLCSIHVQPFEGTLNEAVYYLKISASVKAAIRSTISLILRLSTIIPFTSMLTLFPYQLVLGYPSLLPHLHSIFTTCTCMLRFDTKLLWVMTIINFFIDMLHRAVNLMVVDFAMACLQPKQLPTTSFTGIQAHPIRQFDSIHCSLYRDYFPSQFLFRRKGITKWE